MCLQFADRKNGENRLMNAVTYGVCGTSFNNQLWILVKQIDKNAKNNLICYEINFCKFTKCITCRVKQDLV